MDLIIFDKNYSFIKKTICTNSKLSPYFLALRKNRYIFNFKYKKHLLKKIFKLLQSLAFLKTRFMILCDFKYSYRIIRGKNILLKKEWMPGHILRMYQRRRVLKKILHRKSKKNHKKKFKIIANEKKFFTSLINLWEQDALIPVLECKKLMIPTFSFVGLLNKSFNHSNFAIPINQHNKKENYNIHRLIIISILNKTNSTYKNYILNKFYDVYNLLKISSKKRTMSTYHRYTINKIIKETKIDQKLRKFFKSRRKKAALKKLRKKLRLERLKKLKNT